MFTFLRAIDLDPIEWEEAIHMTEEGSPYIGNVLDVAYSRAKAAVILLTGDDVAYLGQQYVQDHDAPYEKHLTAQARPNVIFEAGMAFGKYPSKTVIVEFGVTRPFTDTTGRNTIRFTNDFAGRKKLADRLKIAGCAVNIDYKTDWTTAGDFSNAHELPRNPNPSEDVESLRAEIQRRDNEIELMKSIIDDLGIDVTQLQADLAAKQAKIDELVRQPVKQPDLFYGKGKYDAMGPEAAKIAEKMLSQDVLAISSPEKFTVHIFHRIEPARQGLMIKVSNESLAAIDGVEVFLKQVRSFDAALGGYRENRRYKQIVRSISGVIEPSEDSGAVWLILKKEEEPQLLAADHESGALSWPRNDTSIVQRWMLEVMVSALRSTSPSTLARLPAVEINVVVDWDWRTNTFTAELQDQASA